jgi:CubicO group peptidase (beta-lactamase class C family)
MNITSKAILMALTILLPVSRSFAQNKTQRIDSLMNKAHQGGQFDGAVLVADEQGICYKNGFGMANLPGKTANEQGTRFFIASVTKPFTAVLIMQLIEKRKIDLTSTLSNYLPALVKDEIKKVTIHQLLSHTSGIPDFLDGSVSSETVYTDDWFTRKLNTLTLDSTAGKFKYASSTYVLLAHIIEKVSGSSYAENLSKNIFQKAAMNNSHSLITGETTKNIATGYVIKDSVTTKAPFLNPALFKGAGSVYSTVEDLYRFDRALYTESLLKDQYKEMMFTTQSNGPYGYGWSTRKLPIGKVVYHEGDLPGYTCIFFRAIERKYCIILLSNNQSHDRYKLDIVKRITGILDGGL